VFGGKDVERDGGLDCSGFVCRVFGDIGIDLGNPDYTSAQRIWDNATDTGDSVLPGDIITFTRTYSPADVVTHIGIIREPRPVGAMCNANPNGNVVLTDYKSDYWVEHYYGHRRIPGLEQSGVGAPEDITALVIHAADIAGVPARLALAAAIAESGLNPLAERWGTRTEDAKAAIAAQDWGTLQAIINDVWADVSFGLSQRIVAFHELGDHSATVANSLAVRAAVLADPAADALAMATRLKGLLSGVQGQDLAPVGGDEQLAALIAYNSGHYPPDASYWTNYAGNVANYRAALARAGALLSS